MVQRLDQEKLQGQLHEHVRRAEWKADDTSNRWQVCLSCSHGRLRSFTRHISLTGIGEVVRVVWI